MAKRNTDPAIWSDQAFRKLPPAYKVLWQYINDVCDNAGVYTVDMKVASICVGRRVTAEQALVFFYDRLEVSECGGYWLIKNFLADKLGIGELLPSNRFHKSIIDLLDKHKIKKFKGLTSPLQAPISKSICISSSISNGDGGTGEGKPPADDYQPVQLGRVNGTRVIVRKQYLHDQDFILHGAEGLREYFQQRGQLEDIQRAGWVDFEGFAKANPGQMFTGAQHLYNAFRKHHQKPGDKMSAREIERQKFLNS